MSLRLIGFAVFGVLALILVLTKIDWNATPPAPSIVEDRYAAPQMQPPTKQAPKAAPLAPQPKSVDESAPKAAVVLPRDPSEDTERDADPEEVRRRDDEERQIREARGGLSTQ